MSTASNTDIESLLTPNHVDMSQLPAPKIIEELSFEDIFEEVEYIAIEILKLIEKMLLF